MSSIGLDFSQLEEFDRRILELSQQKYPAETKKFMQRVGNKFRQALRADLKHDITYKYKSKGASGKKRGTGNLLKGLKRGRAYVYAGNEYQVRVKNTAPHAWLFEHGHQIYAHHAKKNNFPHALPTGLSTEAKQTTGKAVMRFPGKFVEMAEEYVSDFLERGFS